MRFERTTSVLVLATGVICGGVLAAASATAQVAKEGTAQAPPAAAPEAPRPPAGQATKVMSVPWSAADLKPEHALLKDFAGRFTTKVHVFEGPYKRMFDTEGTAEGKLLMDGAFVQFNHAELRMKFPWQAMTIYGYDTATRKYTADTIENTSTATVHLIGNYDPAKKQLVMSGRFSDQHSRTLTIVRTVTTFVDSKTFTFDEFVSHAVGGPETQTVKIVFTRI